MASNYEWDAIIFHTDDEEDNAERLCQVINEYGEKTGRPLNVQTLEYISSLGTSFYENRDNAILKSKFILCSQAFHQNNASDLASAYAALQFKLSSFILLSVDKNSDMIFGQMRAVRMTAEWNLCDKELEKLVEKLSGKKRTFKDGCTYFEGTASQKGQLPARHPDTTAGASQNDLLVDDLTDDATPESFQYRPKEPTFASAPRPAMKGPVHKPGPSAGLHPSKAYGSKTNTHIPGDNQYKLDAIIFHSEDEKEYAESFLDTLNCMKKSLKIHTFDSFSHPGMQELTNLTEALTQARLVLCSVKFYTKNKHSKFFANTVLQNTLTDSRFILLFYEDKSAASPHMQSLKGTRISEDWQFVSWTDKNRLVQLLCSENSAQDKSYSQADIEPVGPPADDRRQDSSFLMSSNPSFGVKSEDASESDPTSRDLFYPGRTESEVTTEATNESHGESPSTETPPAASDLLTENSGHQIAGDMNDSNVGQQAVSGNQASADTSNNPTTDILNEGIEWMTLED